MALLSTERGGRKVVGAVVSLMAACFTYYALARLRTVHHQTFDLALYTRLAYGLVRGELYSSLLDQHFFAGHAPYILVPLGLVGWLVGTAPTLLVAQSLAMAGAALPLYRAGTLLGGVRLGFALVLAYLLHPNLFMVATYEFHPGNLALPGLAYGLWVWVRAEWGPVPDGSAESTYAQWSRELTLAVLWVLLCRADFGLLTTMLGVTVAWRCPPLRRIGALIALASIAYVACMVLWLQPSFALTQSVGSAGLHFGPWGGGPQGIVRVALQEPARVLAHFNSPARLTYLWRVLLPLGLLPCLSPGALLIAAPIFAINLISVFPTTTELYSHYLTPALPVLAMGVGLGVRRLPAASRRQVTAWLPVWFALFSILWGGAPWSSQWSRRRVAYVADRQTLMARATLAHIPAGAAVQAPDPLLPHLAERMVVHRAPPPERRAEYVVFDVSHRRRYRGTETLLRTTEEPRIRTWLARTDFAPLGMFGDFLLLRRGLSLKDSAAAQYFAHLNESKNASPRRLSTCLSLLRVQWSSRGMRLVLRAESHCPADLAMRIQIPGVWSRVDLLFDGLLSPARLRFGDVVRSEHRLPPEALRWGMRRQVHVSLIRSSGAPPEATDSAIVPLLEHR